MARRTLMLFTKPARPGRVKTRLIGMLTAEQAALLHAAFVTDLAARLRGGDFELRIAWALEPDEPVPSPPPAAAANRTDPSGMMATLAGVPGFRQQGTDLGDRLYRAMAGAAVAGGVVAAVGSDHPDLAAARVEEAFARIEAGARVAIGPATDGGYYLIAVAASSLSPRLFADIAWSTEGVLAATLERCRELGLQVAVLEPAADVDTPADLERLAAGLAGDDRGCPRTRELLDGWGLLPVPTRLASSTAHRARD